jgi:tetratricopeptide (TPR) repeat protein
MTFYECDRTTGNKFTPKKGKEMKKTLAILVVLMFAAAGLALADSQTKAQPAPAKTVEKKKSDLDQHWVEENQKLVALFNDGKIQEAIDKANEMLKYLNEQKLGEGEEAARTYRTLGLLTKVRGQLSSAQPLLEKALSLRQKISGDSGDTAQAFLDLADLHTLISHAYWFKAQVIGDKIATQQQKEAPPAKKK